MFENRTYVLFHFYKVKKNIINKLKKILLIVLICLQFSFTAFANNNSAPNKKKIISFKDFKKEFILTNSIESYKKSLKRLENSYNINFHNEIFEKINEDLNNNIKDKIQVLMQALIKNISLKVNFKKNQYYNIIKQLTLLANEIKVAAHLEILLVKEEILISHKPVNDNINNNYFFYLIDHARYEIFTKILFHSTKTRKNIL